MDFALKFALVFFAMIGVDFCWTYYIAKVAEGKAFAGAFWSSMIILCGAIATISYLEDKRLLAAAVLGAFVGTYTAVKFKKKEQ